MNAVDALTYVGRFAPSPTGPLHFGSVVAALASYLDARHANGRWLVRMEDVDETRSRPGAADTILSQLDRLSLHWDGDVVVQSRRKDLYEAALSQLHAAEQIYGCNCSRREVADSDVTGVDGPVYQGTCRDLKRSGPGLAWRVRTDDRDISFHDAIQGFRSQNLAREVGDFVLKRRDGLHAYQLAVVVDDSAQGITHIVRGADLLASTPRQIHLQQRLAAATCEYSHVPVAVNQDGQKLSKQTLAPSIDPSRGVDLLNDCLRFLGQPVWPASDPKELLSLAIPAWNQQTVPAVQSLVAKTAWSA